MTLPWHRLRPATGRTEEIRSPPAIDSRRFLENDTLVPLFCFLSRHTRNTNGNRGDHVTASVAKSMAFLLPYWLFIIVIDFLIVSYDKHNHDDIL